MTQILLIRHAVNDVMKAKKLAGWMPDVHINEEGRQQAQAVAERLRDMPITAIYSSPLDRTRETAEPLAQALGLEVQIREDIGEVQYGDWTGKSLEELSKLDVWKVVQLYPSGMRFPGGETIREMQARIVNQLESIAADHPREIVAVFSHADVIKAALAHYLGVHLDLFQRIVVNPTSVSVLRLTPYGPQVLRINDDGPLKLEPEKEEAAKEEVGGVAVEKEPEQPEQSEH
ncbi:MAG TPA: MSMEG_4193 family putative phosphomutase [Herpetosiphonaceae bacterium]